MTQFTRPVKTFTRIFMLVVVFLSSGVGFFRQDVIAHASTPLAPDTSPLILALGPVDSYVETGLKVFFHQPVDICPPTAPQDTVSPAAPNAQQYELLSRLGLSGYARRDLYWSGPKCGSNLVRSNLQTDGNTLYFLTASAVMTMSVDANPSDPAGTLTSSVSGPGEISLFGSSLYVLSGSDTGTGLYEVATANGAYSVVNAPGQSGSNLTNDGEYIFFRLNNGNLRRIKRYVSLNDIASNVSAYYPDGRRFICAVSICFFSNTTFIAIGNQVFPYNNYANTLGAAVYTSDYNSGMSAYNSITGVTADGDNLFVFERQTVSCSPLCAYVDLLYRAPRGGGAKTLIYTNNSGTPATHLTTDNTYLFWQQGNLLELPNNAEALTLTNLKITGFEATQGIQDLANSQMFIQGRRTFVRVYVQSDGADIKGVNAQLSATWNGGGGPLLPVSRIVTQKINNVWVTKWVGPEITVKNKPDRNNPDDSFVFELPWDWLSHAGPIVFTANLNPYQYPLEPNYADNTLGYSILTSFPYLALPPTTLNLTLVSFGYAINGVKYYPRYDQDVVQTISWLQRAYPVSAGPAFIQGSTAGLHVNWFPLFDNQLGSLVYIPPSCKSDPNHDFCDNLRASAYVNSFMSSYRNVFGIPSDQPIYSLISDAAGYFPRGQESETLTASGPAGSGSMGWDFDGSYADWYAGHEIGHALGRAHPVAASGTNAQGNTDATHCGHSGDDSSYPYPFALLGPNGSSLAGFDPGYQPLGLQPGVYPAKTSHDVMSYCDYQWLSPYTYNAIRYYLATHSTNTPQALAPATPNSDYLVVSGEIYVDSSKADFSFVRRMTNPGAIPPLTPGGYKIQLLNSTNQTLSEDSFTPTQSVESENQQLSFYQAINFAAGTRHVRVIRQSDSKLLGQYDLSANPPVISNVHLVGAPNPVSGTVTLAWSASDPDNDPLFFDILYSRDAGATFQPALLSQYGSQAQVDTARLGGGSGFFRVIANDGANTAQADSPSFTMAGKKPQPRIITPADGCHIHYGQLVNFSGDAWDAQDKGVADGNLSWSDQNGSLGSGALLSSTNLTVGTHLVTLTATNSLGLSATASITVIVDDNLDPPGPALSVAPNSFSWHVAAPASGAQTGLLGISNSGTGDLSWTASSSASWLTIGSLSGTTPISVTVAADPTALQDQSEYTATLTITGAATNLVQVVKIPVGLVIGTPSIQIPNSVSSIYLPVVKR